MGSPDAWPGYQRKRARLRRLARHLRGLLDNAPDRPEIRTELTIVGLDGRLLGRLDLAARGSKSHFIVDYKSGSITNASGRSDRTIAVSFSSTQCLKTNSGSWPTTAYLMPLDGPPVEVVIDPDACQQLAEDAIRVLGEFNLLAPGQQPASAGEDTCPNCHFSSRCSAFWSACSPAWADKILAVADR